MQQRFRDKPKGSQTKSNHDGSVPPPRPPPEKEKDEIHKKNMQEWKKQVMELELKIQEAEKNGEPTRELKMIQKRYLNSIRHYQRNYQIPNVDTIQKIQKLENIPPPPQAPEKFVLHLEYNPEFEYKIPEEQQPKKPKFDMQFDINTIIEPPKDSPKLMIFNSEDVSVEPEPNEEITSLYNDIEELIHKVDVYELEKATPENGKECIQDYDEIQKRIQRKYKILSKNDAKTIKYINDMNMELSHRINQIQKDLTPQEEEYSNPVGILPQEDIQERTS